MRILVILAALGLAAASLSFAGTPQTVVLDVQNMTCPVCPITVRKSLERVPGVMEAKIDLDNKTATVKFDPDKATAAALIRATTEAGYPSTVHK
jgi:periplasmic mercuric ion binding protein